MANRTRRPVHPRCAEFTQRDRATRRHHHHHHSELRVQVGDHVNNMVQRIHVNGQCYPPQHPGMIQGQHMYCQSQWQNSQPPQPLQMIHNLMNTRQTRFQNTWSRKTPACQSSSEDWTTIWNRDPHVPILTAERTPVMSVEGISAVFSQMLGNQNFNNPSHLPFGRSDPGTNYHNNHCEQSSQNTPTATPSNVKLRSLPFYQVTETLLEPTILETEKEQLKFKLDMLQMKQIWNSRTVKKAGFGFDYPVQVQVRFCKLDEKEQSDAFPTGLSVKVNNQPFHLPIRPLVVDDSSDEANHFGQPLDITAFVDMCAGPKQISVTHLRNNKADFCITVSLVEKVSPELVLERFQKYAQRDFESTKSLIKEKLMDSADGISATTMKVSLKCPIGKTPISVPVRGASCSHLQCIDALTFFKMNEAKPKWVCPLCGKASPLHIMAIDEYFVNIIKDEEMKFSSEVMLHADGSWSPVKSVIQKSIAVSTPKRGNRGKNSSSGYHRGTVDSPMIINSPCGDDSLVHDMSSLLLEDSVICLDTSDTDTSSY